MQGYPGGGYPQPPYPQYPGGFQPPPPRSGPNVALIVLVVVVALLVVGGGGCLVCMAVVAKSASGLDAGAPAVERGPLSEKLEIALRKDGIPVDHVACPASPPTNGSFSCVVVPTNDGDPAEVNVTLQNGMMSYKLQEGFVLLEGPKLSGIFGTRNPGKYVPCFQAAKIMKRVDSTFTCDAMESGVVVGTVTTTVVTRDGNVKIDYLPSSAPRLGTASLGLDGTYACLQALGGRVGISSIPRFTIAGSTYNGSGTVSRSADVVAFHGGSLDGWQALGGTNASGRYLLFRGTSHADAMPGVPMKVGDHQCFVQK